MVHNNNNVTQIEGGKYQKISGMWTLKYEIIPSMFYKLLLNTKLKGYTVIDINNFNNHTRMCLHFVTKMRGDFITA